MSPAPSWKIQLMSYVLRVRLVTNERMQPLYLYSKRPFDPSLGNAHALVISHLGLVLTRGAMIRLVRWREITDAWLEM